MFFDHSTQVLFFIKLIAMIQLLILKEPILQIAPTVNAFIYLDKENSYFQVGLTDTIPTPLLNFFKIWMDSFKDLCPNKVCFFFIFTNVHQISAKSDHFFFICCLIPLTHTALHIKYVPVAYYHIQWNSRKKTTG